MFEFLEECIDNYKLKESCKLNVSANINNFIIWQLNVNDFKYDRIIKSIIKRYRSQIILRRVLKSFLTGIWLPAKLTYTLNYSLLVFSQPSWGFQVLLGLIGLQIEQNKTTEAERNGGNTIARSEYMALRHRATISLLY